MNNCLADLSRLIPPCYLKKGRGRVEKTEIIEMAIKHVKHLEAHRKINCVDINNCELNKNEEEKKIDFKLGFQEATSEAVRFLVDFKGLILGEELCHNLVNHLRDHFKKISLNTTDSSEVRERSGSISSMISVSTSRSESSPTPPKVINEIMDTECLEVNKIPNRSETQLRDIIKSKLKVEKSEDESSSSKASISGMIRKYEESKNTSRPSSISPNFESYRPFKKGIKERFQSDMKHWNTDSFTSNGEPNANNKCNSVDDGTCNGFKSGSEDTFSTNVNDSKVFKYKGRVITSVPAFALHPNGSFYIPLTISPTHISQWLIHPDKNDLFSVLHPVNIPVNFNYIQKASKLHTFHQQFNEKQIPQQIIMASE